MMRQRFFSTVVLVGALVAMATAAPPAGAVAGFGDVPAGEFYSDAVQWMVDSEITSGTSPGCFAPGDPATRGQAATFIHRFYGEPAGSATGFVDVSPTDFFADAIGWMADQEITTGTSASLFSPARLVTRGEVATFLHRAAGTPASGFEPFADVSPADFFSDAVGWMVAEGITSGTSPTTFSPDRAVTRAEMATLLYRAAGSPPVTLTAGGACATAEESVELSVAEAVSFDLLNQARADVGRAPLVRSAAMDVEARAWSETMDLTDAFRHSTLGYGENIAWWSVGSASPAAAAAKLNEIWVNSPGHYANMISGSYTTVGVGFWRSDDGGWYATHVFSD
jgi:uncharacterized protein YkwD